MASWQAFSHLIRHRIRYVFWKRPAAATIPGLAPGEIPPDRILREIGEIIAGLDIIRTLTPTDELWRARLHSPAERVVDAARLGTVPVEFSIRSNRMNPAGIPMFYASTTAETARREAVPPPDVTDAVLTLGAFTVSRPARVVDFTNLPPVPSAFDPRLGRLHHCVAFLHDFVADLGREVGPRYSEIDYVPTQVVTEFLLHAWEYEERIDGLMYRSTRTGGTCVVLDVRAENCLDPHEPAPATPPDADLRLILRPDTVHSPQPF